MVNFSVKKRFDMNEFLGQRAAPRRPTRPIKKALVVESPRSEGASGGDQFAVDEELSLKGPESLAP